MFLNLTKDFFLKKNKRKKKADIPASNTAILVVINLQSTSDIDQLKAALKTLFKDNPITFVYFDELNKNADANDANLITASSFNWKADIINKKTQQIFNNKYHIFLCFSTQNKYITKIAYQIQAMYKIEHTNIRNDIFDVSLISPTALASESKNLDALYKILNSFNLIS